MEREVRGLLNVFANNDTQKQLRICLKAYGNGITEDGLKKIVNINDSDKWNELK